MGKAVSKSRWKGRDRPASTLDDDAADYAATAVKGFFERMETDRIKEVGAPVIPGPPPTGSVRLWPPLS